MLKALTYLFPKLQDSNVIRLTDRSLSCGLTVKMIMATKALSRITSGGAIVRLLIISAASE
ncbi:hypothetical protein HA38_07990 [Pantoea allii]|nr:hypothetical protein HA38_07990 [Pantoea allii]